MNIRTRKHASISSSVRQGLRALTTLNELTAHDLEEASDRVYARALAEQREREEAMAQLYAEVLDAEREEIMERLHASDLQEQLL